LENIKKKLNEGKTFIKEVKNFTFTVGVTLTLWGWWMSLVAQSLNRHKMASLFHNIQLLISMA